MELKLGMPAPRLVERAGFNRTFMELKSNKQGASREQARRFNRTFMELKSYIYSVLAKDSAF